MRSTRWIEPVEADRQTFSPAEVFRAGEWNHHIANTAYPIAHARTWGPYRVPRADHAEVTRRSFDGIRDLALYAHVPFCETRCFFCEYTVVEGEELTRSREYMALLGRELAFYQELLDTEDRVLHGFDIGGGTPAFVDAELIEELVHDVRARFQVAPGTVFSIETTPRIAAADPHKLRVYRRAGIDRISMGVQVTQPDLLKKLNRDGNGVEHHLRAVANIREAGFERFNVDLMYGFAGQSLASWRATLEHALDLEPEFVTLYRMRYKLTRISDQAERVELDEVRAQKELAHELLHAGGFRAKLGKNTFSRLADDPGTSDYLTRRVIEGMPYLGLGLGAQSFSHSTIGYNDGAASKSLAPYRRSLKLGRPPIQDLYELPRIHAAAKMVAVSFYFGEVNLPAFQQKFGASLAEVYPQAVAHVLAEGLMERQGDCLSLTPRGARHFNGTIALFYAPSVQRVLLERCGARSKVSGRPESRRPKMPAAQRQERPATRMAV